MISLISLMALSMVFFLSITSRQMFARVSFSLSEKLSSGIVAMYPDVTIFDLIKMPRTM